jgi:Ca2+/H+ antiporter, TMEM165/GDT1 family
MDLFIVLTTFAVILPAELPDKTMVATLVLATRFRPIPVWIGVVAAFFVQCLVAVVAGGLLTLLPRRPLLAATAVLFATGSYVLLRGAGQAAEEEAEEEEEYEKEVARRETELARRGPRGDIRAAVTSFLVLFAAEWGDLSQLLTAGLVVRHGRPLSVFIGAWLALACIAALAVLAGRTLLKWIPLETVRRAAGVLFGLLAAITAAEAAGLNLPGPV